MNKEAEQKRIDSELAKIRKHFGSASSDRYATKKYVWKLLYMFMLGYDIEFGHMEALRLITSDVYSEKSCGYMACQLLWNEKSEFLRLMVQSIRNDITNQRNDVAQSLALSFVANIGGMDFAESLAADVQNVLFNKFSDLAMPPLYLSDDFCRVCAASRPQW